MQNDACEPCRVLEGAASSVLPHLGLFRTSRQRIPSAGSLSNWIEFYRCADCSAELKREVNASLPRGRWLHQGLALEAAPLQRDLARERRNA